MWNFNGVRTEEENIYDQEKFNTAKKVSFCVASFREDQTSKRQYFPPKQWWTLLHRNIDTRCYNYNMKVQKYSTEYIERFK